MSRGLGKIERTILMILRKSRYEGIKLEIPVIYLAREVIKHDVESTVLRSQNKSVCRVVKSLERKN